MPAEKPNCRICNLPLDDGDILFSRTWHPACETCHICKEYFPNHDRIRHCLDTQITISHITCFERERIAEVKNKLIPVTREHVQALNGQILSMRHTQTGESADVELLLATLRDLQECAANVSFVLSLTKDKIKIADSQDYAEKIKTERRVSSEQAAVELAKKVQLAEERANPELRDKRKAIAGYAKLFGITVEQATEHFAAEEAKAAKGKTQ